MFLKGDATSDRLTKLEEIVRSLTLEVDQLNRVSCYPGKKDIKKSKGKKGHKIFDLNTQRVMKLEDDFQFLKLELIELKKSFNNFIQKNETKVVIPPPPPPPPPPFSFIPRPPPMPSSLNFMHKGDGDDVRLQKDAQIKSKKILKVKRIEITKPPEDESELSKIFSLRRIKDTGQL
ncbi:uncharacterized protein LOC126906361 isoform X2 [Daktulosphaira vitifoliae]|uniref:uncharacterized protein LOC126906361 isoform X2 n=1 Tax=Daktulosphaira vitifoliae TaxID=58002 RepID=UPI0021AA258C|nr:uncharacterized protein LOC126906361 isoform X2 [Daktulosphaira vitifoliae]